MPNYNLTTQQIKDTYEQLVQVSGSAIVDGTGSLVNAFDYPSNSTFTSFSSSVAAEIAPLVASSGSAEWNLISGIPAGLVSSSAQVDLSQAFGTASLALTASFALNVTDPTWGNITGKPAGIVSSSAQTISNLSGTDIISSSAQIATDISGAFTSTSASLAAGIATNTSNISTQTSRVDSLVNATSSYAVTSNNNTFTGTQTFNNIAVNGTASFGYLQSITGSAKIIGDAFIILNNDTPTLRYAGIKVQDSGSTNTTASIQWDGGTDDWFVEKDISGTTEYGVVTLGPEYTTIGTPTYNTNNTLVMSNGGHHLNDSPVSVSASVVTITGQVSASSYIGDGSGLTGISSGLVAGTGTDSMKSSDALTTNPATASGDESIAIGDGASATGTSAISIGADSTAPGAESISIGKTSGRGVGPDAKTVAIGNYTYANGSYSVLLGTNTSTDRKSVV